MLKTNEMENYYSDHVSISFDYNIIRTERVNINSLSPYVQSLYSAIGNQDAVWLIFNHILTDHSILAMDIVYDHLGYTLQPEFVHDVTTIVKSQLGKLSCPDTDYKFFLNIMMDSHTAMVPLMCPENIIGINDVELIRGKQTGLFSLSFSMVHYKIGKSK